MVTLISLIDLFIYKPRPINSKVINIIPNCDNMYLIQLHVMLLLNTDRVYQWLCL
jgi:hypothetical protein